MKVIIIGGVAGGASAAARLRRLDEQAEIVMLERSGFISYANCGLPYYIGGEITDEAELTLQTPESFGTRFRVDVRVLSEAIAIDTATKTVRIKNLQTEEIYEETYDKLLLAPGARPMRPNLPGLDDPAVAPRLFTLRTVEDTLAIHAFIEKNKPKSVVIAGGGYIGIEMAENLQGLGMEVTMVQRPRQLLKTFDSDMTAFIHEHIRAQGVTLRLGETVEGFGSAPTKDNSPRKGGSADIPSGQILTYIKDSAPLAADMVILAIGVAPDTTLAKEAGLTLGVKGSIVVNDRMETSAPDVYAVGDAVEVTHFVSGERTVIALAGPANKQGRIAADNMVRGGTKGTVSPASDASLRENNDAMVVGKSATDAFRREEKDAKVMGPAAANRKESGALGAAALEAIRDFLEGESTYKGAQGSSVIKVFEMTAAGTGLTEKGAADAGINADAVILSPADHASYYPGSRLITLKVVYEKESFRLLGAQAVGFAGVEKRIDVLATALRAGMTGPMLKDLDLTYAPPYSSAKDPVNMAGFMIDNIQKGVLKQFRLEDIPTLITSSKENSSFDTAKGADPSDAATVATDATRLADSSGVVPATTDATRLADSSSVATKTIDAAATVTDMVTTGNRPMLLLDTRTPGEFRRGHIEGFINVPVDDLRDWLATANSDNEMDSNRTKEAGSSQLFPSPVPPQGSTIYVICQSGLRSYIACRILEQYGYDAYNFTGGFRFYDTVTADEATITASLQAAHRPATQGDSPTKAKEAARSATPCGMEP